jgi:thiamine-phosphate pyrophosphorylase
MGKETSILERFKAAKLYVVTTEVASEAEYVRVVEQACEGGADIIQFRNKTISHRDRYAVATRLKAICAAHKVLFIVNDHLEIAMAAGADGVHLGQDDLPMVAARQILHQNGVGNFLVGRSTHSLDQALQAQLEGADYIGIGPVFATPTKPTYNPVGLELVRRVTREVITPHVAIGGIDAQNIEAVLDAGAERVAVVRAVCSAADIAQAAREIKSRLRVKAGIV